MNKTILLGAAAALFLSGSALAQSTTDATPSATSPTPLNNNPATGVDAPPAAGTTGSSMGATTDDTAGATSNRSSGYSDSYGATSAPAPAGSASQYGSDTATGQPYNPVPPSQTEMNRAGERG